MWRGIKRHTAKEFRKSTLGNDKCANFKKWCENTPFNLSEIFFHKNFKRGKCQIKKKTDCKKMARKSPKMLSKYKKTCKNGKNREKTRGKSRHFIFRSHCFLHASIDTPLCHLPSSFLIPPPVTCHTTCITPPPTSWVVSFPPIEVT